MQYTHTRAVGVLVRRERERTQTVHLAAITEERRTCMDLTQPIT